MIINIYAKSIKYNGLPYYYLWLTINYSETINYISYNSYLSKYEFAKANTLVNIIYI